jgi:hypothetical protein
MNIALALGYEPTYEPWQFLYTFIILWSAMVALGGLIFDLNGHHRVRIHWTGALIGLTAFFSMHPLGMLTAFGLNVLLFETAPIEAALIAAGYTLFGISAFIYCWFGERFWKRLHEK